ncbi:MAG: hypothetical protein KDI68_15795 [Gammaproteobacteria bacterium]|nr:hypothetical protein [Gammaproteobacteria bacterium]
MKLSTLLLAATLLPLAPLSVPADTLLIDAMEKRPAGIHLPYRGMDMQAVRQRFGAPQREIAAVGEPPISRWVYDGFTVYFEHRTVITSVPHR